MLSQIAVILIDICKTWKEQNWHSTRTIATTGRAATTPTPAIVGGVYCVEMAKLEKILLEK